MIVKLPAWIYQQFDADYALPVPGEGYGGWKSVDVEMDLARTALVSMHAWGGSVMGQFPGLDRCVEYRPRSFEIMRTQFPPLLRAAREAPLTVIHVVGGGPYYRKYPGFQKTLALMSPSAAPIPASGAPEDPLIQKLVALKSELSFVGAHNAADAAAARQVVDFGAGAEPVGDEYIAEDSAQLHAVCRHLGISHLIYIGFAINWCILLSPGGMADMSRKGYFCSAVRQAVTAVENKESARTEAHKEEGLWRTALAFGLVFDAEALIAAWTP